MKGMRKEFITNLLKEIVKKIGKDIDIKIIFEIIIDMLRCLDNEEEEGHKTN